MHTNARDLCPGDASVLCGGQSQQRLTVYQTSSDPHNTGVPGVDRVQPDRLQRNVRAVVPTWPSAATTSKDVAASLPSRRAAPPSPCEQDGCNGTYDAWSNVARCQKQPPRVQVPANPSDLRVGAVMRPERLRGDVRRVVQHGAVSRQLPELRVHADDEHVRHAAGLRPERLRGHLRRLVQHGAMPRQF